LTDRAAPELKDTSQLMSSVTLGVIARTKIPEIDSLIETFLSLDGPEDREVVVGVETAGITDPVERTDDRGARWIALPQGRGFGYNRDIVLRSATGDVMVWTDCDCVPQPDWLKEVLLPLESGSVDAVAGSVIIPPSTLLGDCIAALGFPAGGTAGFETIFGVSPDGSTEALVTVNAAMRRFTALEVGGFDRSLIYGGEDTDLARRLIRAGKRIVFAPRALVTHPPRTGFVDFCRWSFRRGRAKALFARNTKIGSYVGKRLASWGAIIRQRSRDPRVIWQQLAGPSGPAEKAAPQSSTPK
jgi:GT2 family glycosyltransferase